MASWHLLACRVKWGDDRKQKSIFCSDYSSWSLWLITLFCHEYNIIYSLLMFVLILSNFVTMHWKGFFHLSGITFLDTRLPPHMNIKADLLDLPLVQSCTNNCFKWRRYILRAFFITLCPSQPKPKAKKHCKKTVLIKATHKYFGWNFFLNLWALVSRILKSQSKIIP